MGSISDKISYLEQTKREIADAIVEKGQTVQDSDTFRSYADKIKEISSGGGSGGSMQRTVIWEGTVGNVGDSGICSQSIEDFDFLLAYGIPLDVQTETHLQWLSVNDIKKNYGVANFSYEYYDTIYIQCAFIDNKTFQCLQAASIGSSRFAYKKIEGIKFQNGGGGSGNIYSTEEQIIGTWINGKPIYSIVTNEQIDFYDGDTTELVNDVSNFEGHCSSCAIITESNISLGSINVGNNYIKILIPIDTGKKISFNRSESLGGNLYRYEYWIGSSIGASDIDIIIIDKATYNEANYTDEIDLEKYKNHEQVYITINLNVVAYDSVRYKYNSILLYEKQLKQQYSFILKSNIKLGLKETGYKYYSEYTKK